MNNKQQTGFTIVELLIVIVVIGILAAISIVAYNGVQNRANDSAVQTDLSNLAKKIRLYEADAGYFPAGSAQLATLGLKVTKGAYTHYFNGTANYNLVYCRMPNVNPTQFAIVAYGKSGKNYQYTAAGQISEFSGAPTGSAAACAAAGVTLSTGSERDWLYDNNAWQYYVGG